MMQPAGDAILLNEKGARRSIDAACLEQKRATDENATVLSHLVKELGFVLIVPVHHVLVIELCHFKLRPLAALAAFYEIKNKKRTVDCVVLAFQGDTWRRSKYEIFNSRTMAAERMDALARSASRRVAAELKTARWYTRFRPVRRGTNPTGGASREAE